MVRKSLNVGLVMNLAIMHLNVLKERKTIRESLSLEEIEIACMLMKMKDERDQSESDDEFKFVAIKEDDLNSEIREERALVSQVEKKYN